MVQDRHGENCKRTPRVSLYISLSGPPPVGAEVVYPRGDRLYVLFDRKNKQRISKNSAERIKMRDRGGCPRKNSIS
jgi:hypothetical protein